ncbi:phosphotransferase [Candidatus Persebacteraceae bacterium Df01]|jgi:aminoglycoside/choline kinase family phosphotransferase|uniref:Phosphotransferase n=1 Tax=Candidatus Doriopsillibacter californiensis TaxID=2970740 RepID=A0ABT7QN14_9GAMM|nr:phosphotransferase [Candidatus Persebacteraceae bacterium Df01]
MGKKANILTSADSRLTAWVQQVLDNATVVPLCGDASFRRYFRVHAGEQAFILMDSPPPEDIGRFLRVRSFFAEADISVPALIAADEVQGLALLEDFGDATYLDCLRKNVDTDKLYADAWCTLITMQQLSADSGLTPPYDASLLMAELMLYPDWYCARYRQMPLNGHQREIFDDAAAWLVEKILMQPQVVVHRDFHARNLMRLSGARNPGVLDFQDAVVGSAAYDMVSLLRDAYIEWPREQQQTWLYAYWRSAVTAGLALPEKFDEYWRDFNIVGAQRALKVLGIFARLCKRDGKVGYLSDMPLVQKHLLVACEEVPELAQLGTLATALPPSA